MYLDFPFRDRRVKLKERVFGAYDGRFRITVNWLLLQGTGNIPAAQ